MLSLHKENLLATENVLKYDDGDILWSYAFLKAMSSIDHIKQENRVLPRVCW